ncbi:unnamed protein product [Vitrella brassicaformis CCMP3155]|uniref:G8 domain-containing protein n=1 Tax=Vitrella brassicaformis (strain CCMP3155) TaxID=1169540 RepID=A0A0G4ESH5_VITBC|nr:unnamed protein product [Vitrella brassicaformis CCMP3155]|eukprot:CEM00820.1 unnamed protein product [Vitrella brassicaformis CCMP3155]
MKSPLPLIVALAAALCCSQALPPAPPDPSSNGTSRPLTTNLTRYFEEHNITSPFSNFTGALEPLQVEGKPCEEVLVADLECRKNQGVRVINGVQIGGVEVGAGQCLILTSGAKVFGGVRVSDGGILCTEKDAFVKLNVEGHNAGPILILGGTFGWRVLGKKDNLPGGFLSVAGLLIEQAPSVDDGTVARIIIAGDVNVEAKDAPVEVQRAIPTETSQTKSGDIIFIGGDFKVTDTGSSLQIVDVVGPPPPPFNSIRIRGKLVTAALSGTAVIGEGL